MIRFSSLLWSRSLAIISLCLILSSSIAPSVSALTGSEDIGAPLSNGLLLREREMLLSDISDSLGDSSRSGSIVGESGSTLGGSGNIVGDSSGSLIPAELSGSGISDTGSSLVALPLISSGKIIDTKKRDFITIDVRDGVEEILMDRVFDRENTATEKVALENIDEGAKVVIYSGTTILGETLDLAKIDITSSSRADLTGAPESILDSVNFGIAGEPLRFSKPVKIELTSDLADGTSVVLSVRHEGSTEYGNIGLTLSPEALCIDGDVSDIDRVDRVIVTAGKIVFYTCGASTFVISPSAGTASIVYPVSGSTVNTLPLFAGTGSSVGATITLTLSGGAVLGTATVYAGGNWTIQPTVPFAPGAHTVCISGGACRNFTVASPVYSDGSRDTTFMTGSGASSSMYATALQPDDKILIGGLFTTYSGATATRIARLNTDGSLDTTFVSTVGADNFIRSIALQSDGKVIIGGNFTTYNGVTVNSIARLNTNGSLDTTFVTGAGIVGGLGAFALQPDGKILIGGGFTTYNGITVNSIARLNTNGSLDTTFVSTVGADNFIRSIALQSDGKVIIGGNFTTYNGVTANRIVRLAAPSNTMQNPANGSTTATPNPWFSGTGSANGSTVTVTLSGSATVIGTGVVTGGYWSFTPTTPLAVGPYTVCVSNGGCNTFTITSPVISNGKIASDLIGQYTTTSGFQTNWTGSASNNGGGMSATGLGLVGGIALDTVNHRFFAADQGNARVLVYNLDNNNNLSDKVADYVLGKVNFSTFDIVASQSILSSVSSVLYDSANQRLFVVDYGSSRVLIYNVSTITNGMNASFVLGKSSFTFNVAATSQSGLKYTEQAAYDSVNQRLFLADYYNNRVVVYNVATITNNMNASFVLGQPDFTTSSIATTQAGMNYPRGVTYDSVNQRLFVGDTYNNRTLVYNVATITNGMNASFVLGQPNFTSSTATTTQSGAKGPVYGVYDTINQRLFVSDSNNNRVLAYNVASGSITNGMNASFVLGQPNFTSSSNAASQTGMYSPYGLDYDSAKNRLYVGDYINRRISLYDVVANISPVANPDTLIVTEDGSGILNPILNDTDADSGDIVSFSSIISPVSNGTLTFLGNTGTYTPNPNFCGTDTFTYQARDIALSTSNTSTGTITVTCTSDAPTSTGVTQTINEDTIFTFTGGSFPFSDADSGTTISSGKTLTSVTIVSLPSLGSLTLSGVAVSSGQVIASGSLSLLVYTPVANGNGTPYTSFLFRVTDDAGLSSISTFTFQVNVTSINDAPIANDDSRTVTEDTSTNWNLRSNDTDPDGTGDTLTLNTWTQPSHGVATLSGIFLNYVPTGNYCGPDAMTYTIRDQNFAVSNTGNVTITVTCTADAPTSTGVTQTIDEDTIFTFTGGSFPFSDADSGTTISSGKTLSGVTIISLPSLGTLKLSGVAVSTGQIISTGSFALLTYTPPIDANGSPYTSFTFRVTDDAGLSSTSTFTFQVNVTSIDDAPIANPDSLTLLEDGSGTLNPISNDTDVDIGDIISFSGVISPISNGTLTFSGNTGTYTPNPNFCGTDTFTYQARDTSNLVSNTSTGTITVTCVNDAPVAVADTGSIAQGGSGFISVLSNDTDPDTGDTKTITGVTSPGSGSILQTATGFTYTASSIYCGTDTFTYRVVDASGSVSSSATVSITITSCDTTPPDTTITSTTPASLSGQTLALTGVTYSFSATESGSTFACKIDLGSYTSCTSSYSYTGLTDGAHTISVRATDIQGNTDLSPAMITFTIDTTPPIISTFTPFPSPSSTGALTLTGNAEPGSTVTITNNSGTILCTSTANASRSYSCGPLSPAPLVTTLLTVTACDTSTPANCSNTGTLLTIDTTPPTLPSISPLPSPSSTGAVTLTGITDPGTVVTVRDGSGTVLCTTTSDGSGSYSCGPLSPAPSMTTLLTVTACDGSTPANCVSTGMLLTVDIVRPVITLSGSSMINILKDAIYTDKGAICTDNYGPLTQNISASGSVNTSLTGAYILSYSCSDAAGNAATGVSRTVNVTNGNAPVITLSGSANIVHEVGTTYVDSGATASDTEDGNLTSSIVSSGSVNTNILGAYTIAYDVTDTQGNAAIRRTRTIQIVDTTPPLIIRIGSGTLSVLRNTAYTDLGAIWTDNYAGSGTLIASGGVNTGALGTYILSYHKIDPSGNIATPVTRSVQVVTGNIPVITLSGSSSMNITLGSPYIELGATASDIEDGDLTVSISRTGSVNTGSIGTYTVIYTVTDTQSNTVQNTRTITVGSPIIPTSSGSGIGGGGSSSSVIGPIVSQTPSLLPRSPLSLSQDPVLGFLYLLPSQTSVIADGVTKTGQEIFTLKNRLTEYICPQIVKVYDASEIRALDIPKVGFTDDVKSMIMFRGLEKDEKQFGQSFASYKKSGIAINDLAYEPENSVTRAEYVKMIVRALSCRYSYQGTETPFADIDSSAWYTEYIAFAVKNKWIKGYKDGTFRPDAPISRAEAAKILSLAIQLDTTKSFSSRFSDVSSTSDLSIYIETLRKAGVFTGKTEKTFDPDQDISRVEVARIIYKTFLGGQR